MKVIMGDDIHKTHFQVPEMPWKKSEKEALLILQRIINKYEFLLSGEDEYYSIDEFGIDVIAIMDTCSDSTISWIQKL